MIALGSYCQTTKDTICVNRAKFVNMLTKAEQAKAFEQQRDLLLIGNDTLKARIVIKDMQLVNKDAQISDFRNIIRSKDAIISTQGDERKIFDTQIVGLVKDLKKERRKTKGVAFLGILIAGISGYLYITK